MTILGQATFGTPPRPGTRPVVLAVGEVSPYGARPDLALWCEPRRASGDRLRRIMGLTDEQYLAHVARFNLFDDGWSPDEGLTQEQFLAVDRTGVEVIVLLGARVREALRGPPPFEVRTGPGAWLLGLPHPSGRCRAWNDADAARRARAILGNLVPRIPWGTAEDRM